MTTAKWLAVVYLLFFLGAVRFLWLWIIFIFIRNILSQNWHTKIQSPKFRNFPNDFGFLIVDDINFCSNLRMTLFKISSIFSSILAFIYVRKSHLFFYFYSISCSNAINQLFLWFVRLFSFRLLHFSLCFVHSFFCRSFDSANFRLFLCLSLSFSVRIA